MTLEKSKENVTGKSGLAWFHASVKHFGIENLIAQNFTSGGSNVAYSASEKILSFSMMLAGGGNKIEDLEVIRKDAALLNSCDMHRVCGPDTMRNFFLNPSTNQSLKNTLGDVVAGALKKISIKELTLDNDWTFIESNKTSAEYSYLKTKGYGALLSCIPELDLVVDCDYRPGNTHPGVGIVDQIKNVSKVAADAGKAITKFRADSAAHTVEVFNACEALNMKFYVSASKTNHVKELIKAIPEYLWIPLPAPLPK